MNCRSFQQIPAFSMTSGINLGLRHILPIYPFIYAGIAAVLARAGTAERPGSGWVRLAVRLGIQRRLPSKCAFTRVATISSAQLRGIGGWNSPSGSCGMCSIEPEIPANFSACAYHGSMSL